MLKETTRFQELTFEQLELVSSARHSGSSGYSLFTSNKLITEIFGSNNTVNETVNVIEIIINVNLGGRSSSTGRR